VWPLAAGFITLMVVNLGLFFGDAKNLAQNPGQNPGQSRVQDRAQEYTRHGALLLEDGQADEGVAELEKAVALEPGRFEALYLLADAHYEAERYEDAARLFERVVRLRPGDHRTRFSLGTCYLGLERYEDAVVNLESARELKPRDTATLVNLAAAYEGAGRIAEAMDTYRAAIGVSQRTEIGYIRLTELLLAQGDTVEARAVIEEGVVQNQASFLIRYQLAATIARMGDYSGALEELDIALHMRPENEAARRLEALIKQHLR